MNDRPAFSARTDVDTKLDGLLISWFEYHRGYTLGSGYRSSDTTSQDYRTPGHYDWANGAADEHAEKVVMQAVDAAIQRLPNHPERWKTAIEFHARNLHSKLTVWYSPLLPPTRAERDVLILEARNKLMLELRKEGVIG
ncbi:MAG: hypothetical protein JWQ03_1621 [Variovorax sp.]|nr:hypothetical protein [Variovorax sp.]